MKLGAQTVYARLGDVRGEMWSRCDHISLYICMKLSRRTVNEETTGETTLTSPLLSLKVPSSLGTGLQRKDAPFLWLQVNQV